MNKRNKNTSFLTRFLQAVVVMLVILIVIAGALSVASYRKAHTGKGHAGNAADIESTSVAENENNEEDISADTAQNASEEPGTAGEAQTSPAMTSEPSPSPSPTNSPKPKKKKKKKRKVNKIIAIDAGHQSRGDSSTEPEGPGSGTYKAKVSGGATGVSSGVPEYKLTLQVAQKLRKILAARGYQVYMVRTSNDVRISNKERAQAANNSGADIYIRIHADGSSDSSVNGSSALYPSRSNPYVGNLSDKSKKLSQCVLDEYCKKTGLRSRGLYQRNDLTGTNWSKIPVTLIEMGFLSNPSEDQRMQQSSFQKNMAEGIANGIDLYYDK